jgi:hypothetical protein
MLKIDVLGPAVHAEVAASSTMTRACIKMWGDARMADAELQNLGKSVDAPHHHLRRPKMGNISFLVSCSVKSGLLNEYIVNISG